MTKLSPLEETLFNTWTRAHGVDDHDDPNNRFDYRGLYKQSNGMIQPGHFIRSMAQAHNQATEPQEATEQPDPYMAAAEMQGNQLKFQGDQAKDKMKLQIEQMKLAHKSAEANLERQFKREESDRQRQQDAQDRAIQAQQRAQEMQVQSQQRMQEQQVSAQQGVQDKMLQEHLTRTRPQPQPTQSQPQQPAAPQQAPSNLGRELTNRALQ